MYVSKQPSGPGCCGMGALTMDGTGLLGTGLFAGGLDLSTWGTGELVVAGLGLFILYSVFSTTSRAASSVSSGVYRVRKGVKGLSKIGEKRRKAKAEKLREEARRLEGDSYRAKPRRF